MAWTCPNNHPNRDDGASFCRECGVAKPQQTPPAAQQPPTSTDQEVAKLKSQIEALAAAIQAQPSQANQTSTDPTADLKAEIARLKGQLSAQQKGAPPAKAPEKKEGTDWWETIRKAFWDLK